MNEPYVSIIIPTYNDWGRLLICLNALNKQSYSTKNFEIIVVNNNRFDNIPDRYEIPENCKIITEVQVGSYAARNSALEIIKGEIIGFTDSDCVPNEDWIENAIEFFFQHKKYTRLAGNIQLFYKNNYLTTAELYEKIYAFKQEQSVKVLSSGVTGNMFAYRKVFETVGNFKDDLLSGGDHEWSKRAQIAGFEIGYGENVIVRHPARFKIAQLVKKAKRIAGGRTLSQKKNKIRVIGGMIKIFNPPVKGFAENMRRHGKDLSLNQKMRVFLLKYYLNIVERFEEAKVSFGKSAIRE
ncbi:MAG: glycosyltransferase family 2 protein [Ginsengibacter sp.]